MPTSAPVTTLETRSLFRGSSGTPPFVFPGGNVHEFRRRPETGERRGATDLLAARGVAPTVDISPREIVTRSPKSWHGMTAEIVQVTRRERIDVHFRAPVHLLVVVEQGIRVAG